MQRIGIYAGTFDPVHDGHVAFAEAAVAAGYVDTVVFIPEPKPRYKQHVTATNVRFEQLKIRLEGTANQVRQLSSHHFDIATTLPELRQLYPDAKLSFLFGSDIVLHLHSWAGIKDLLANHQLLIGMRSNDDKMTGMAELDRLEADYHIITTAHAHLSSSQLRSHRAIL